MKCLNVVDKGETTSTWLTSSKEWTGSGKSTDHTLELVFVDFAIVAASMRAPNCGRATTPSHLFI
jgi:hypothetical protein